MTTADSRTIERRGRIAIRSFNRPRVLDAFDGPLVEATTRAMSELSADEEVLAIVRGEGRAFSALGSISRPARPRPVDAASRIGDGCSKPTSPSSCRSGIAPSRRSHRRLCEKRTGGLRDGANRILRLACHPDSIPTSSLATGPSSRRCRMRRSRTWHGGRARRCASWPTTCARTRRPVRARRRATTAIGMGTCPACESRAAGYRRFLCETDGRVTPASPGDAAPARPAPPSSGSGN
jgi:hypothetical protein